MRSIKAYPAECRWWLPSLTLFLIADPPLVEMKPGRRIAIYALIATASSSVVGLISFIVGLKWHPNKCDH